MKKSYEEQFITIANEIMKNGFEQVNKRTGIVTRRIPHAIIQVDLQEEPVPILQCKNVFWKTALKEILWIMQQQSNNIHDLEAHIWDEWADENGSIGKSYGYQVGKTVVSREGESYLSQVHYVLERLKQDSSDRRCVIDLWNVDDLKDMNLCPCCYSSIWDIVDGKLNCMLVQRSSDYLVGVPFNTTQYALLTHLFARHLGVEVGILTHCMADAHIYQYDSHLNNFADMHYNWKLLSLVREMDGEVKVFLPCMFCYEDIVETYDDLEMDANCVKFARALKIADEIPKLVFTTDETDFFKINVDDIQITHYSYMQKMKFDVAV